MKSLLIGLVTLLPSAALADFECFVERQCGGGQCAPWSGESLLIKAAGDVWQVDVQGTVFIGYDTSTVASGEVNIVVPTVAGTSGLISIMPSGASVMTFHSISDNLNLMAVSAFANCVATGG